MSDVVFRPAQPVQRNTVADIVQHIVHQALANRMAPGDRFPPERQLGDQLGVGRSTLREALKCLHVLGFVEIRQGDGTYLAGTAASLLPQTISWSLLLGSREADELIEAKYFIEVSLARLAAMRRTSEEVIGLDRLVEGMRAAGSPAEFAEADARFHLLIATASRNPPMSAVLESIKSLLDAWILRVIGHFEDRAVIVEQHRQIAETVAAGDADGAANRMGAHIAHVTSLLRASLEVAPEST